MAQNQEVDGEPWLTRREAVEHIRGMGLPCTEATLATRATRGGGPRFVKFGSKPLYKRSWNREWIDSQLSSPRTSSSAGDVQQAA